MIPQSPGQVRAVLKERGLAPSKRLGQSFLADRNLRDAIVKSAEVEPGDRVLEVGPGLGMLTLGLLDAGARVVAVELDRGLSAFLREEFSAEPSLRLIEGDILHHREIRPDALEALEALEGRFRVVSNLPYSAATPFIAALARLPAPLEGVVVMVQYEVARRLAAGPGEKDFGPLAVLMSLRGEARILREIGGRVFVPPVKIRSALISITLSQGRRERALIGERAARDAFLYRRKSLRRSLIFAGHAGETVSLAIEAAGADPTARPETLSPDMFVAIGEILYGGG